MFFKESCFLIFRKNLKKKVIGLRVVLPKGTLTRLLCWKFHEIFREAFFTEQLSVASFVKTKTDFFSLKDRDLTASINPINILMFMIWIVLFRTFKVLGIKTRTSMESFFQPANSNSLFIFYSNEQQASFHQNLKNALRKIQLLKDVKYAIS